MAAKVAYYFRFEIWNLKLFSSLAHQHIIALAHLT